MTREEAIERLKWYFEEDDGTAAEPITKQAYKKAIEALKQPEQKKAKWIPKQFGDCECSNCHEEYGICGGLLGDYNYCPYCGADMRGEKQDG